MAAESVCNRVTSPEDGVFNNRRRLNAVVRFMRFILSVLAMSAIAFSASAQTPATSTSFMSLVSSAEVRELARQSAYASEWSIGNSVQRELYVIPKAPGERMMKVGKTLTVLGAAAVIGGILVYNNRDPNYSTKGTYGTTYDADPHEAGGQLLVGIGTGMIVPGVMVWIHGAKKFRKYEEKQRTQALYIPAGKVGLAYLF